jgi:hypothetical protein
MDMKKEKSAPVIFRIEEIPDLPEIIWNASGSYQNDKWEVPKNRSLLKNIVSDEDIVQLYDMKVKAEQNIYLRILLSDPLKAKDQELRLRAMKWVIYDWGHIRGKRGSEEKWSKQLGNYEEAVIDKFIRENYKNRIASWSKVLAFADSSKYAIYDAFVVMSLNTILDDTRYEQRFYMPPPSSEKLPKSFSNIKKHVKNLYPNKQPKYLGYFEYMNLLNAIVNKKLAKNILEVEMCLFANGIDFAKKYAAKHGLVV